MSTATIYDIRFKEVVECNIETKRLFEEISLQIDKLEMNNYSPKILIIYSPVLKSIQLSSGISTTTPEIRQNKITGEMQIMGLKVIPIDYEIENYVKVY